MKKSLRRMMASVLSLIMLFSCAVVGFAAETVQMTETDAGTVTVKAANATLTKSNIAQTVNIDLLVDKNVQIAGLTVNYAVSDTNGNVTLDTGVAGNGLSGSPTNQGMTVTNGNGAYMNYDSTNDGYVLCTVPVTIAANATGTYTLTFSDIDISDADNGDGYTLASQTVTSTITVADTSTPTSEYTANISTTATDNTVVNGQEIQVAVNVGGTTGSFSSAQIVLDYDPAYLAYVKTTTTSTDDQAPDFEVDETDGLVTIRDYGATITAADGVYTVTFTAAKGGNTNVSLTSAGFSTQERAETLDLLPADGLNTLAVTINHKVTVNDTDVGSVAPTGDKSYTVSITNYDANYNYEVSATVGGTTVTPVDNGNGTYTINNINGDVIFTYKQGDPKSYEVKWTGDIEDVDSQYTAITSATYGTAFTIALPENREPTQVESGVNYTATVSVGSNVIQNLTGGQSYTIDGNAITDDITINVVKDEVPALGIDEVTITVSGDPGVSIEGATGNSVTVEKGTGVTLILTEEPGYLYSVVVGSGDPVTFTGGRYTFTATESVTVTVTKTLDTGRLNVYHYLNLDGTNMYLVTIGGTEKIDGKVYTFTEEGAAREMFWSSKYQEYATLIVTEQTDVEEIKSSIAGNFGLKDVTDIPEIDYIEMDVNKSGTLDVNDAQLVWNMYNAQYNDFTANVTIEKYLRADVTGSKNVDVTDAAAIMDEIKN